MLLDFGSGYRPRKGFKTCDVSGWAVDYHFDTGYYIIEGLVANSVFFLHCRNVLHHIPKLEYLVEEFHRVIMPGGLLQIIDCAQEQFPANVFLDRLWYRGIIPRPETWFSEHYRNYGIVFSELFTLVNYHKQEEKEFYLFRKGTKIMTEQIKEQLEAAGYDYAVAIATEAEVSNGAACGQLSVITEEATD